MPGVQRFAVAVAGVLLDDAKRVLLIRERGGARQYGLPGSLVEDYDSPEETLVKVFELQTGVRVAAEHVIGVRYRAATEHSYLVVAYRCRLVAGAARDTGYGEIDEVGWFETRHLPSPMASAVEPAVEGAVLGGRGMIFPEFEGEATRRRSSTGRRPKA